MNQVEKCWRFEDTTCFFFFFYVDASVLENYVIRFHIVGAWVVDRLPCEKSQSCHRGWGILWAYYMENNLFIEKIPESLVWEQPKKQVNKMTRQRNYGVFGQKSLVTALSILQQHEKLSEKGKMKQKNTCNACSLCIGGKPWVWVLCAGFSGRLHGCGLSFRRISLAVGVLARIPILGDLCKSEKANMFYLEAWVLWTISWFSELLKLETCGVVKVFLQLGGLLTNLPTIALFWAFVLHKSRVRFCLLQCPMALRRVVLSALVLFAALRCADIGWSIFAWLLNTQVFEPSTFAKVDCFKG